MAHNQIYYSDKYDDEEFEYRMLKDQTGTLKLRLCILAWKVLHPWTRWLSRFPLYSAVFRLGRYATITDRHVMLPKDIAKLVPKTHLMSESEWRNLGVQQSQGWVHYMIHEPEPHILLFRRPLPKKPEK